jgi:hypothetical protein
MDNLENLEALFPIDFFSLELELPMHKKVALPDTSELLAEESFADVKCSWTREAFFVQALIRKPFEDCFFPEFERGDSLELFINTRALKKSGFATRFCHHFLILPRSVQGITSQEITRARGEEAHPLCNPDEISVETDFRSAKYSLEVTLPTSCLYGFDPEACERIGFTYRLNRFRGAPQHFSVSSAFYAIEEHPGEWASLTLKMR